MTEFTVGVVVSRLTGKLFGCLLVGGQLGESVGTYGLCQGILIQLLLIWGSMLFTGWSCRSLANVEGRGGGVHFGSSTGAGSGA